MSKPDQISLNTPEALNRAYIAPEVVHQRQRTLEALDIQAREHILDIGCGTGFLSYEMALVVGEQGKVLGIDPETSMVESTLDRCKNQPQVNAKVGEATNIPAADNCFDIVTCTQVLLYVAEVEKALGEMYRILKSGGRVAIVETDWRGLVWNSRYPELTAVIAQAWDATVASPNLPCKLANLLRNAGFKAVKTEGITMVNSSYSANSYSVNAIPWLAKNAVKRNAITKQDGIKWSEDLESLGKAGQYFFSLNRFLFVGVK